MYVFIYFNESIFNTLLYIINMNNVISFTKVALPYGWLGNMSPHPVVYDSNNYKTTEALFQCMRFKRFPEVQKEIRECKSPMGAKMIAKKYKHLLVKDDFKDDIVNMKLCLELKVQQHTQLKEQLLNTNNSILIEDCTKRSSSASALYWGAKWDKETQQWVGNNILGALWKEIRNKLQN